MVKIRQIVWDEWNVQHILLHNVGTDEVEKALSDVNVAYLLTYNKRVLVLGRSSKRLLSVVMAEEKKGVYYIITARDMSKRERKVYGDEQKKQKIT